ncbi:MAG: hypothetical protein NVS9B1_25740 [Candidatus Dormibacteraceae bacterium]
MRSVSALVLALAILAPACAQPPVAPTTATISPGSGTVEVLTSRDLYFAFTRPVGLAAVSAALRVTPTTEASLTADTGATHFTYRAQGGWKEATEYHVHLAALRDSAGNEVRAADWTFKTTITPRVVQLRDGAGRDLRSYFEVLTGTPIVLTFNTPMAPATTVVTANGAPVTLSWSDGGRTATLPTAGFAIGLLTLGLTAGNDLAGHRVDSWVMVLDVTYEVAIATRHLPFPALVQIPNDGYGARPQVGIQAAAIVFEYQTEGSIQRMTALFTDVPDVIGPIRSGRRISFRLTRHYHGALFYSGLSNDATHVLNSDPVPNFSDSPPAYYRDFRRSAPDNLMLSGEQVLNLEKGSGVPDFAPLRTGHPDLGGGEPATVFTVGEHRSSYAYDPLTGTYSKVEDGQTMFDAALGRPDQMFMVIVLHTAEFLVADIESGCCTRGRDFNLDSGGQIDIYYQGRHTVGAWSAADRSSPLLFKSASGRELVLPKGLVWVDVVGS